MPGFEGIFGVIPYYLLMLRSQYWVFERLRKYVEKHLDTTLSAAMRLPFYREHLGSQRVSAWDLSSLPTLARAKIPQLAACVRSVYPSSALTSSGLTSGSTGNPASFFYDGAHQASRFGARARYLRENGWNPLQRNVWIVSTSMQSPDLMFVQRKRLLGMRFISHLTDLEKMANTLRVIDPLYLYSYPVNLDGLARVFEERGERLRSLRMIFSGSEVLDDSRRERVERVFGVGVADNYGSTEAFIAWQCPGGNYHTNAEHVVVEVVDDAGRPAAAGKLGRVLVTTLHNRLMPLIRYEIGDYAIATEGPCRCGRTLPRIGPVAGRDINLFVGANGRHFTPWPLFQPLLRREWIKQNQIVQRANACFVVRYVGDRTFTAEDETEIQKHFQKILRSPFTVAFERLEVIPRARSGKFMMAVNEMETPVKEP